jgi:hypothetical protein
VYKWGPKGRCWTQGLYDPAIPHDHLISFSDADFAASEDRKSTSGYSVHLKLGQAPVIWGSCKQTLVSRSTTEAETVAAYDCHQETDIIFRTLQELCMIAELPAMSPVLYFKQDNAAVISQLKGIIHSRSTVAIGVKAAWLREKAKMNLLIFQYVTSLLQCADLLTKPLTAEKLLHYVNLIMGSAPEELYEALRAESTLPADKLPATFQDFMSKATSGKP